MDIILKKMKTYTSRNLVYLVLQLASSVHNSLQRKK